LWFGFLAVFAAGAVVNSRHNQLWWPFVAWTILTFALPSRFSFSPFAKHPLAEDLIVRVDRARRRSD
jgi:hypothetical protein